MRPDTRRPRPLRRTLTLLTIAIAGLLLAPIALIGGVEPAQPDLLPQALRVMYHKREHQVPMRDGVRLFTAIYAPANRSKTYPILLTRTPYSVAPYGEDRYPAVLGPSSLFAREGFIFVYQDVRGRMMSEGAFADVRPHNPRPAREKTATADLDESTDTFDTIAWLLATVPNHNGRVGLWGISYPGFYAAAGMIDAHPALKAVSPQAPISDWFMGDDFHHHGALFLPHAFDFFSAFGQPRARPTTSSPGRFRYGMRDGYRFYLRLGAMPHVNERHFEQRIPIWNDLMAHETYDVFWQARNLRPHLKAIAPAVLTVGGWFDAENLFGALEVYKWTERQGPQSTNQLVMGPWDHGGWARTDGDRLGEVRFDVKTGRDFRERIELPFFVAHLKGNGDAGLPEASVFRTGANEWHALDAWPPVDVTPASLYLRANGGLAFDPPGDAPRGDASDESDASATSDTSATYDTYVSDPAQPVPYINHESVTMTREYMVDDQRFAAARRDVLVYQTGALAEDLTIAGPIEPDLVVSTSGTDSDWIVKVIDVHPDDPAAFPDRRSARRRGYQQLVRGDVLRGKFRNSAERPEPFVPDQPTRVAFTMPDVFHTFRRGHRIMVQIQSTWFPLVNRNPQVFTNINTARDEAYRTATQRIYRSAAAASRLRVSIWTPPTRP